VNAAASQNLFALIVISRLPAEVHFLHQPSRIATFIASNHLLGLGASPVTRSEDLRTFHTHVISSQHHAEYGIRPFPTEGPVHAISRITLWFLSRSITAMLATLEFSEDLVSYPPSI
jgi:hypothetical protein